jgi:hypothetical protein
VLNGLHRDMDPAGFANIFTHHCPCQEQVRAVRSAKSKGERYVDHVDIVKLTTNLDAPGYADVLAAFDARVGGLVGRHNHRVTYAAPQRGLHRDFQLVKRGHRWLIYRIVVV